MKLDVLVFAAHPDDAELGCSGTIFKLIASGHSVGIIDLTRGQLGSRGSVELRNEEAAAASKIMGLAARENLDFEDGYFVQDKAHQEKIIRAIRKYTPEVVIANAPHDRHPDHGRGSRLVRDASFYSGLRKIETDLDGNAQEAWRPKKLFFYIQDHALEPDFVVDIEPYWAKKKEAILAFQSQFFDAENKSGEPQTYISSKGFFDFLEARARDMGHRAGVLLGEGFISETPLLVKNPMELL
ncbi:MAG: bacillithiol biosynthesis deacetylase BshB1 [Bacteroidota bacterium]